MRILNLAAWLAGAPILAIAMAAMFGWISAWPAAFFGMRNTALGLPVIALMLLLTAMTIRAFHPRSRPAGLLLVPYLAWTLFATYLNAGFWWLNRS
jgi:tryptophan-rich sensory protein